MAFKYTTITQPVPLGGLNTRDEPTLMSRLQTPDIQNIEIDRSFIKKRLGYITLGTNLPLSGIGMELIQYNVAQSIRSIIFPQCLIFWTKQQIIQHFIVCE